MENHGFFRIMAVSPEVYPGDTEKCLTGVRNAIDEAEKRQASLLVLISHLLQLPATVFQSLRDRLAHIQTTAVSLTLHAAGQALQTSIT